HQEINSANRLTHRNPDTPAAGHVPVVIATNLSRGHLLHLACARFLHERSPHQMSSTVIDRHPATKRDAPSATAKRLAEAAGGAQIEILRHGNAVADHHVIYTLAGETIEIVHRVTSLEPSVLGALDLIEAASRLTRPGLYDIESPELRVRC
ncbi:dihydrodipicolinate reductase C-terminal domain-containing protein, partial [Roseateles sp.]|uniref:dihydrodipicolinate reductase C-terminal domain-containing protein n=1 Tax=Roseateles sp. TaxID=1971397 RepID=UPI003BA40056